MKFRLFLFLIIFLYYPLFPEEKRVKVLLFLAEECPICQYYTLPLKHIFNEYNSNNKIEFKAYFPNKSSSIDKINKFKKKYNFNIDCELDSNQLIAKKYEITVTPEIVILNYDSIVYKGRIDDSYFAPGKKRSVFQNYELKDILSKLTKNIKVNYFTKAPIGCYITFK